MSAPTSRWTARSPSPLDAEFRVCGVYGRQDPSRRFRQTWNFSPGTGHPRHHGMVGQTSRWWSLPPEPSRAAGAMARLREVARRTACQPVFVGYRSLAYFVYCYYALRGRSPFSFSALTSRPRPLMLDKEYQTITKRPCPRWIDAIPTALWDDDAIGRYAFLQQLASAAAETP